MSAHFRRAEPSDRETVIALCTAYRVADHQPAAEAEVHASVDAALRGEPLLQIFLVELGTRTAGYFALTIGYSIEVGGRDAFLDELFIEPWAQSQGLGTQAIAFAERLCSQLDVKRLRLEVEHDNPRARALYESLGFTPHARAVLWKRLGSSPAPSARSGYAAHSVKTNDKPWFRAKRYGWGWGAPTCWQGWVVVGAHMLATLAGIVVFVACHSLWFVLYMAVLSAAFLAVCWWKGEPPRWRWGGR